MIFGKLFFSCGADREEFTPQGAMGLKVNLDPPVRHLKHLDHSVLNVG